MKKRAGRGDSKIWTDWWWHFWLIYEVGTSGEQNQFLSESGQCEILVGHSGGNWPLGSERE